MLNDEQKRLKEKLLKQVKRYEEKGYTDTAAHTVLANLLKAESDEGVNPRNTKKVKQEAANGE
jgi:hypothetical protein